MNVATGVIVMASTALAALPKPFWRRRGYRHSPFGFAIAIAVGIAIAGSPAVALPANRAVAMYLMPAVMIAWVSNENFRARHPLAPAAARACLFGTRCAAMVAAALMAVAAGDVGDGRDLVADRVPARGGFSLVASAGRTSRTRASAVPGEVNQHVTYLAVGHNLGILWVDALCRWYRHDRRRFTREVLYPLAVTADDWKRGRDLSGLRRSRISQPRFLDLHAARRGHARRSKQARRDRRVLDDRRAGSGAALCATVALDRVLQHRRRHRRRMGLGSRTGLAAFVSPGDRRDGNNSCMAVER